MMGISNAYGYELIKKGELDSYLEGRIRKVVVASIHDYIGRRLKAEKKRKDPARTAKATAARMEQYANGVQPPRRGKRREPVPIAAAPAKPLPKTASAKTTSARGDDETAATRQQQEQAARLRTGRSGHKIVLWPHWPHWPHQLRNRAPRAP